MTEQGGRLYEGDVVRIARMIADELQREQKAEGSLFSMDGQGFPGGANSPDSNDGGGDTTTITDPTYTVTVPAGTTGTITFEESDLFGGINLFFDFYRGDPLVTTRYGSGVLFILQNGTAVLRCDLLETTGPDAGFDTAALPDYGFSAVLSGTDLILSVALDNSDAEDTQIFAKPVSRARA